METNWKSASIAATALALSFFATAATFGEIVNNAEDARVRVAPAVRPICSATTSPGVKTICEKFGLQ